MTEAIIPSGALGHLCDDFNQFADQERDVAIQETQTAIENLLPNHKIFNTPPIDPNDVRDYFSEPPLTLEEARVFEAAIRDWARPKGYDYCPCYLLVRIDELAKEF